MVEVADWIDWLKSKGLSDRTIKNYSFYYNKFDWENLEQRTVIAFLTRYRNDVARAFIKNISIDSTSFIFFHFKI